MMFAVIARAQDFQTSCTQDGKQICRLSDLSLTLFWLRARRNEGLLNNPRLHFDVAACRPRVWADFFVRDPYKLFDLCLRPFRHGNFKFDSQLEEAFVISTDRHVSSNGGFMDRCFALACDPQQRILEASRVASGE